jgi:hypothetical protein
MLCRPAFAGPSVPLIMRRSRGGAAGAPAMNAPTIIATRESRLALWQAEHVRDLLLPRFGLRSNCWA